MFKNILVAIDGSAVAKQAVTTAIDEAKIRGSDVCLNLVYVAETGGLSDLPMDSNKEMMYNFLETSGNKILEETVEIVRKSNIPVKTFIKYGHAGEEIVKLADEIKATLIVVGSTGKSNLDKALLGSVSEYVTRNSHISTMVVRL